MFDESTWVVVVEGIGVDYCQIGVDSSFAVGYCKNADGSSTDVPSG
jgi:hypothetical protein